ncbi:tetratricopeptide repeat protein [Paludisphaera mucosa]|uniref:Tetratricopeptide repeat protein n=1 Tax=Paludisphaera mucosa TaxID=3030827 RepID=A0ABT6FK73_9BACT|nr:tetratricopeptide repeat protein [Paludisphaera mucosa]MDG3007981.1 tetratricopeptide repeat protein [Paludisphaera mucosa]
MDDATGAESEIARLTAEAAELRGRRAWAEASARLEEAVGLAESAFGGDDPRTARVLAAASWNAYVRLRHAEAADASRRALAICEARLGPDHADTLRNLMDLAGVLFRLAPELDEASGRRDAAYRESRALADRALAACAASGRDDVEFADFLGAAGYQRYWVGLYEEAGPLLSRAFALRLRRAGLGDPETAEVAVRLALNHEREGYDETVLVPMYRTALAGFEEAFADDHPDVLDARARVAMWLEDVDRGESARQYDRIVEALLAPGSTLVEDAFPWYLDGCGDHLREAGREADLQELERRAGGYDVMVETGLEDVDDAEKRHGADSIEHARALATLAEYYADVGRVGPAVDAATRAGAILRARLGPDHPEAFEAAMRLEEVRAVAEAESGTPRPRRRLGRKEPDEFFMLTRPWADERRHELIRAYLESIVGVMEGGEDDSRGAVWAVRSLTIQADADEQWSFLLDLIAAAPDEPPVLLAVAAGPLVGFLERFGGRALDRAAAEAARDATFGRVLSGVRRNGLSDLDLARLRAIQATVADPLPETGPFGGGDQDEGE